MPYYNELIDKVELIDLSQTLSVANPAYLGNRLFPDRKTQFIQQESSRLCMNGNLPQIAMVHAHDTEAHIASRIPWERVKMESLLIKEKINQTEQLDRIFQGIAPNSVTEYVFDDAARLFDMVVARAEKAKIDAFCTGKYTITENNLNMVIDYLVPEENFVETFWDEEADILGDIDAWRTLAVEKGVAPNRAVTTEAVVAKMKRNKGIQIAINGVSGTGIIPSLSQINAYLSEHYGITVETYEARYVVPKMLEGGLVMEPHRFFPEDKFVMYAAGVNGSIGTGLWGVTPEEREQGGAFDEKRQQQFVTISQWSTPDPVNVWTKASGVFAPIMPNVWGHIIANVAAESGAEG